MLFLSLALVPLGMVAMFQTRALLEKTRAEATAAFTDRMRAAARQEREDILSALGAAEGLTLFALTADHAGASCREHLRDFAAARAGVAAVGFIQADGRVRCASNGRTADVSASPQWPGLVAEPRRVVDFRPEGPVTGEPVILSMVPVRDRGRFAGYVFVSSPQARIVAEMEGIEDASFLTFNAEGEILRSSRGPDLHDGLLPADLAMRDLASATEVTFTAHNRDGTVHAYAVIPVIEDIVYAVGVWPQDRPGSGPFAATLQVLALPVLMWLTSLTVAYIAVHRLVVRHIRALRHHMAGFATRRCLSPPPDAAMAQEVADIFETFHRATETILRDEAEMEALVHEKNVLLKEVHHRVKNNLQLISSIMNMQMRKVRTREAQRVVRHLQSRILSLATVHRNLYRTSNLGAVDAGSLLDQLVNQLAALAGHGREISVRTRFDDITLYPDQAVPVSLLTAEAVTNALKNLGACEGSAPWLSVELTADDQGYAELIIENSKGPTGGTIGEAEEDGAEGTGLGMGLMQAFAGQLETVMDIEDTGTLYRLSCRFRLQGFVAEPDAADAA